MENEHQHQNKENEEKGAETVDVQIHSRRGKPLQMTMTAYVVIQLVMGGLTFGAAFTSLRGQIESQGLRIEELRNDRSSAISMNQQVLDRLARIEERIDSIRE